MSKKIVLSHISHEIGGGGASDGKILVSMYNHEFGIKINRRDPESFKPIFDKLPDGVDELYMPSPTKSNAKLLPWHHAVLRYGNVFDGKGGDKPIYYDGATLSKGGAYAVTSADCPTIVVWGLDHKLRLHVVAAHAGRDSLVDRTGFRQWHGRDNFSVVQTAIKSLYQANVPVHNMHINVYCGIRTGFTNPLDHPQHWEYNQSLVSHCLLYPGALIGNPHNGEIDLYALIHGQAVEAGVYEKNILFDDIDTGIDAAWASRRRPGSWDAGERNLVIVSHI